MNLISIIRAQGSGATDSVVPGASVIVGPGDRIVCEVPFAEVSSIFRMDHDLHIVVAGVSETQFKQFFASENSPISSVMQFEDQTLLASDLNKLLSVSLSLMDASGKQHIINLLPGSALASHPGDVFRLNATEFEVDNLNRYGDDLRIQSREEEDKIILILVGFFIKPSAGSEPPQLQLKDPEVMTAKDIMIHPNSSVFQWQGEPLPRAVVGSLYGYYFQLDGKDAENYVLVAKTMEGALPAWLTFAHLGTGRYFLSGMPTPSAVGTHEIAIFAHSTAAGVGLHTQQFYRLSILSADDVITRSAVSDVAAAEFRKVGSLSDMDSQMSTIMTIENMPYMTMPEIAAVAMLAAVNPMTFTQVFSNSFTPYSGQLQRSAITFEYHPGSAVFKGVESATPEVTNLLGKTGAEDSNHFGEFIQVEQIVQPKESTQSGDSSSETTTSESSSTGTSTSTTTPPTAPPVVPFETSTPSGNNNTPTQVLIIHNPPPVPPNVITLESYLDGVHGFTLLGDIFLNYYPGTLGSASFIVPDALHDGFGALAVASRSARFGGQSLGDVYAVAGQAQFPAQFHISDPGVVGTVFYPPTNTVLFPNQIYNIADYNGDGFTDLLFTAYTSGGFTSYIVFGSPSGFPSNVNLGTLVSSGGAQAITSPIIFTNGGALGDVTGSGYSAVGLVHTQTSPNLTVGYVVFGGASPPSTIDVSTLNGTNGFTITSNNSFGIGQSNTITGVDLNGDGFNDILFKTYTSVVTDTVSVILGSGVGFPATVETTTLGQPGQAQGFHIFNSAAPPYSSHHFADPMINIGNFNGSGIDAVAIADLNSLFSPLASTIYVIFGSHSFANNTNFDVQSLNGSNGFKLISSQPSSYVISMAYLGDVNGDGMADLGFIDQNAYAGLGAAYIIFGSAGGFSATIDYTHLTSSEGLVIKFTAAVSALTIGGGGDLNGDGLDDIVLSNPTTNVGPAPGYGASGVSYVVFGDNFTNTITQRGQTGVNVINGTGSHEVIFAGPDNHTINLGSGITYVDTGAGHDIINGLSSGSSGQNTIVYSALNTHVFAGSGNGNTLWLQNDGTNVNFVGNTVYSGINIINERSLQEMVGNKVTLDAAAVHAMSNNNTMTVNGDAHDTLYLVATDYWTATPILPGQTTTTYTSLSGSQITVDNAVHVLFVPTANPTLSVNFNLTTMMDGVHGFSLTHVGFDAATSSTIVQNGDGFGDLLVANGFGAGLSPFTRAFIVDGQASFHPSVPFTDPSVTLTQFNSDSLMSPIAAYGQHVSSIHDFNGDGINDILISEFYGGPSFLMLGDFTSSVLFSTSGISITGQNTNTASALGNVNGDYTVGGQSLGDIILSDETTGWGAVIFGTTTPGASIDMTLLNGTDGFQIARPGSFLTPGLQDVAGADLAGDGKNDIFVSYYNTTTHVGGIGVIQGQTAPFSATVSVSSAGIVPVGPGTATGFLITNSAGVPGPSNILINPTDIGNFTHNGIDSIALSSSNAVYVIFGDPAFATSSGFDVASLNGTNGFELTSSQPAHITSIAAVGDVNGDGVSDFAFLDSQAYSGLGAVYVVFGSSSPFSANIDYTHLTSNQGFVITDPAGFQDNNTIVGSVFAEPTVSGGGDLNGDGLGDIVITSGSNEYVLFGGNFTGAITQFGSSTNVIQGTGSHDVIYAGAGDQIINGGLGTTFINGGAGNDIINGGSGPTTIVYDAFDITHVDAGSSTAGQNTLWLENDGILANLQNTLIFKDFDIINLRPLQSLTGNMVELNPQAVANMNTHNALIVDGGAHDILQLNNVGSDVWSAGATVSMHGNNYTTYTSALTHSTVYAESTLHQVSVV